MGMTGILLGPKVWTNPTLSFSVTKWVENVNWSLFIVSSFETLYGGQFTLSTQLIKPNYLVVLSHQCSTIVSIETYPLNLFYVSYLVYGPISGWSRGLSMKYLTLFLFLNETFVIPWVCWLHDRLVIMIHWSQFVHLGGYYPKLLVMLILFGVCSVDHTHFWGFFNHFRAWFSSLKEKNNFLKKKTTEHE